MKIVFLDAGTFYGSPDIFQMLSSFGEVKLYACTAPHEVKSRIEEANIVLTNKVVLDESHFLHNPQLKLICVTATGTNNIDYEAAKKYGVTVKNASNYSTHSVAQTTWAMALSLHMRIHTYKDFVFKSYSQHPYFTHLHPDFTELKDKTWGIVGLGNIGKKVAAIAQAFEMQVVYHSPSGQVQEVPYPHVSLEEICKKSDFLSLHTPLNSFSRNLISEKEFKLFKPTSILINVARGGIVDEQALVNALDKGKLGGAGVDVFSIEPILRINPLLNIKRKHKVIFTPHIAWGSVEARQKLMDLTCQNISDFLKERVDN